MGKIIVSENGTLDGVIQDPAGDEGFRAGGWVGLIKDSPPLNKLALDEALGAEALLLGRRSYEWFAARWPSRSGELADRLNSMPKYVVSSVLGHPAWNNSTVLRGGVLSRPCLPEIPTASRSYRPESAAWAMWDNSAGRSGSDRSQAAAGIMSRCRTSLTAPKPCRASRAAIASGANSESQGSPRSADAWPIRSA